MHSYSATALQSVEIACDTLLSGKAKVMLAGGFDDLGEEGSYEFGNMKATSSAEAEFAMGREPTEMSRPTTTTRSGVSLMFISASSVTHSGLAVHGGSGQWCPRLDEREDCDRDRCAYPRHRRLHVDVFVS